MNHGAQPFEHAFQRMAQRVLGAERRHIRCQIALGDDVGDIGDLDLVGVDGVHGAGDLADLVLAAQAGNDDVHLALSHQQHGRHRFGDRPGD